MGEVDGRFEVLGGGEDRERTSEWIAGVCGWGWVVGQFPEGGDIKAVGRVVVAAEFEGVCCTDWPLQVAAEHLGVVEEAVYPAGMDACIWGYVCVLVGLNHFHAYAVTFA